MAVLESGLAQKSAHRWRLVWPKEFLAANVIVIVFVTTKLAVVQLDFFLRPPQRQPRESDVLLVDGREVRLEAQVVKSLVLSLAGTYVVAMPGSSSALT